MTTNSIQLAKSELDKDGIIGLPTETIFNNGTIETVIAPSSSPNLFAE